MSDVTLVLDGDEIAFQIAAACETRGILVTNTKNESQTAFKTRTKMKEFLDGVTVPEGLYSIEDTQIAEDAKNAFATVKAKINNYKSQFNTDNVEIYLSGADNFRDNLPLPFKYKSNRSDSIRPLLLSDVRNYLSTYQKAQTVNGYEVDDKVAMRVYDGYKSGKKIIGTTSDKDAMGYTGWVYNPDKMSEPIFIEGFGNLYIDDKDNVRGQGRIWTYHQSVFGDRVDGYAPSDLVEVLTGKRPRFGEKASYKLLSETTNDKEALCAVRDQYIKWFGDKEFQYQCWEGNTHIVDWIDIFQMYFNCAKMLRWEGDFVDVRVMLKKMGVI